MKITGLDDASDEFHELADSLEDVGAHVEDVSDSVAREVAYEIRDDAREEAPRGESGRLKESIHVEEMGKGSYLVITRLNYAKHVEYGTRPTTRPGFTSPPTRYTILPHAVRALRFRAKSGEIVYAQRVRHPGVPAQPFMRPALDENRDTVKRRLRSGVSRLFRKEF